MRDGLKEYRIECVNERGEVSRTLVVACRTLEEAQNLAPKTEGAAILIRPRRSSGPRA